MGKGYLLDRDEAGRPLLKGAGQETGGHQVFLRSGFSEEEAEDEDAFYSPTLLLNADLAQLSEDQLLSLAICEKYRSESVRIRSYIREFRPTVALVSSDSQSIDSFEKTYGGLLDIVPVRLEKGASPSFSQKGQGLLIEYERPLPLDRARCTLCRKCALACHELAIDDIPSIDLSKCTFCNRCVESCPTGAIDLHRMERVSVEANVAVLPDDPAFQVPDELRELFFVPSTLPRLFSRIGTFQVEEAVVHNVEFCAFEPRLGVGCKRCLSACTHGAIRAGKRGMEIDQTKCVECGACVSVCPTGAMEYERFPFKVFARYFGMLGLTRNFTLVIGKEKELRQFWWKCADTSFKNTFFLEHPQPLSLSCIHFLFLFALGAREIIVLEDDDSYEKRQATEQASLANAILNGLFPEAEKIVSFCSPADLKTRLQSGNTGKIHEKALLSPENIHPSDLALSENKRDALNAILSFLYEKSMAASTTFIRIEEADSFSDIEVDEECSLCLACLNVCSQNALNVQEDGEITLFFERGKCINCGACSKVCPERAVGIVPGLLLDEKYFSPRAVSKDEPMRCKNCGKVFGNRKSFERAMSVLQGSGRYDSSELDVLSLCADCRARQMLEEALGGKDE